MATPTGLGAALRKLRDRRTLSTREIGKLADIDHAYIHRLETGDKTKPSPEIIQRLLTVLKTSDRDSDIVKWLTEHPDSDHELVDYVLDTPSVLIEEFTMAAGTRYRGTARPDPATQIERVRKALKALNGW